MFYVISSIYKLTTNWASPIICAALVFFYLIPAKAQSTPDITYHFKMDTVSVEGEKTFSNLLIINNSGSKDVVLIRKGKNTDIDFAILGLPVEMTVKARGSSTYPLKYFADSKTIRSNIQLFQLRLQSTTSETSVQESASFSVILNNPGGLIIDAQSPEIYLDPISNKADVQIRVFNDGLIPLTFQLDLTEMPKGLEFLGNKNVITLEPKTEKLLPFVAVHKSKKNAPADYAVIIRALDLSAKQISFKRIRIMTLSSNRNLVLDEQDISYYNRPNTLSLNYFTANGSRALQMFGGGNVNLKNNQKVGYQVNMNYAPLISGYLTSSGSYVSYENKQWGVKVGNIFENQDYNIFGRGVKGALFIDREKTLSVYAVENNPVLFSTRGGSYTGGSTIAAEYVDRSAEKGTSNLMLVWGRDRYNNLNTALASGKTQLIKDQMENLTFGAGYSVQVLENEKNAKVGVSLELNYDLKYSRGNFVSSSYYSSPQYGGLRRGVSYSENRFTFSVDNHNMLSARMSITDNRPVAYYKDYSDYVKMTSQASNQIFELGYQLQNGRWSLGLFPYYFGQQTQTNGHIGNAKTNMWKSVSARARLELGYGDVFQTIRLNVDNGYTYQNTSNLPPAPFFSSRVTLLYRNNVFGFTAFYQHRPYYIFDALANRGGDNSNMLSAGPNVGFAALKRRLSVTGSLMYNYYGYNGNENYSANMYSRFLLKGDWTITSGIYYGLSRQQLLNTYNPQVGLNYEATPNVHPDFGYFANHQISVGIEKRFGRVANPNIKKLKISYFGDLNGNGIKDNGEKFLPGVLVKVKDLAAITNGKGSVEFSAPQGEYEVSVVNQDGWTVSGTNVINLAKDSKLEIGMVQTSKLIGSVQLLKEKYLKEEINLAGIRVNAVGENGLVYSALCGSNGGFNFFLPEGKYVVYLKDFPASLHVIKGKEEIAVIKNKEQHVIFEVQNNQVNVEVKEF